MQPWQDDLLTTLHRIATERELFAAIRKESQRIGFDYCAYGLRLPLPLTNPKTVMLNDYPDQWQKQYIAENYLRIDPTVRHAMKSLAPQVWDDEVFKEAPAFWESAHAFGLRHGWAQSSIDLTGIRGMLTLARSAEPLTPMELKEKSYQMVWLTQIAHFYMSKFISKRIFPERAVQLSLRETEVLRWTGEGKTSGEISDILNLSERTVNFHIANAIAKLNCTNKTAATAKAVILGILC